MLHSLSEQAVRLSLTAVEGPYKREPIEVPLKARALMPFQCHLTKHLSTSAATPAFYWFADGRLPGPQRK